jgi:hypothetical protein
MTDKKHLLIVVASINESCQMSENMKDTFNLSEVRCQYYLICQALSHVFIQYLNTTL